MAAERVREILAEWPVVASVMGEARVAEACTHAAAIAIVAGVSLNRLGAACAVLKSAGTQVIVNVDSCPGLASDAGGIEYVHGLGVAGICSTRAAAIDRAKTTDLLAMLKVFVTDRSTLRRSMDAVRRCRPDLVQLMPSVVVPELGPSERAALSPYLVAGFVRRAQHVVEALSAGAVGACTSDESLWAIRRNELQAES